MNPTLTIEPTTARQGELFIERGTGYCANTVATMFIGIPNSATVEQREIQIDQNGEFYIPFVVPLSYPLGAGWIEVEDVGGFISPRITFTVEPVQDSPDIPVVSNCDFQAPPLLVSEDNAPLGNRIPLMLVHGITSECELGELELNREGWRAFVESFWNESLDTNFKLFRFRYASSKQHVNQSAKQLKDVINTDAELSQSNNIVVVAHSMGGLVTLDYMINQGQGDKIQKLISLATPYQGTPFGSLVKYLNARKKSETLNDFVDLFWPNLQDILQVLSITPLEQLIENANEDLNNLAWGYAGLSNITDTSLDSLKSIGNGVYSQRYPINMESYFNNGYLVSLANNLSIDHKIKAYCGSIPPDNGFDILNSPSLIDALDMDLVQDYLAGLLSLLPQEFQSDGIVPRSSAEFDGQDVERRLEGCFPNTNHTNMPSHTLVINAVLEDLRRIWEINSEPILVEVDLDLGDGPFEVGKLINGSFTIKNQHTQPITLNSLTVGGRYDQFGLNEIWDFPHRKNLILDAGATYTYIDTFTPTKAGEYHFFVGYEIAPNPWNTNVPNLSGNVVNADIVVSNDVALPKADLTVDSVFAPTVAKHGDSISVSWRAKNIGTTSSSSFNSLISLSIPPFGTTYPLGTFSSNSIGAGGNSNETQTMQIPNNIPPGDYYVTVFVDSLDAVMEGNENNNINKASNRIAIISNQPVAEPFITFQKTLRPSSDPLCNGEIACGPQIDLTSSDPTDGSRDVIFRLEVTNTGGAAATFSLLDPLGNGDFVCVEAAQNPMAACNINSNELRIESQVVQPNSIWFYDFRARYVGSTQADGAVIPNTAEIIWIDNYYDAALGIDNGRHGALSDFEDTFLSNPSVNHVGGITFSSNPSGRTLTVQGQTVQTPYTLECNPGSLVSASTNLTQTAPSHGRYSFRNWSNGSFLQSLSITCPNGGTTMTAIYDLQYQLITSAAPNGTGNVSLNPAIVGNWYNVGSSAQLTPNPINGQEFSHWSDDCSGTIQIFTITITKRILCTANFILMEPDSPSLSATAIFTHQINLNWTSIPGASSYTIERKDPGSEYLALSMVSSTSYVDNSPGRPLLTNAEYCYRVRPQGFSPPAPYSNEYCLYTRAATPNAPTVSSPSAITLFVTVNPGNNPTNTWFALFNETANYYVSGGGENNGMNPYWLPAANWGTTLVRALNSNTTYRFKVKARNGSGIETGFGPTGSGTTATGITKPTNIAPAHNATGVSFTATLQASVFNAPHTLTHSATRWQIRINSGSFDEPLWDSHEFNENLTSRTVPSHILEGNTIYWWRVSYRAFDQNNTKVWSPWSDETKFTTVGAPIGGNVNLANTPCPTYRCNLERNGLSSYIGPENPTQKWKTSIRGGFESPVIGLNGEIYYTYDNRLRKIDQETGNEIANYLSGDISGIAAATLRGDGLIYVSSLNEQLTGTTSAGDVVIQTSLVGRPDNSSPAIGSDGTVYVVTNQGTLYFITPSGGIIRTKSHNPTSTSPTLGTDGTIYVLSLRASIENGKLYAYNPNGSLKWAFDTGGTALNQSTPAVGPDGTIHFIGRKGFGDYGIFAVRSDGTEKWFRPLSDSIGTGSPAVGPDGTVYFTAGDLKLYALNSANGNTIWTHPLPSFPWGAPAIDANGTIYATGGATLLAVNPNGTKKWEITLDGNIYASPVIDQDGTLYIATTSDSLYAFENSGSSGQQFTLTVGNNGSGTVTSSDGFINCGSSCQKSYDSGTTVVLTPTPSSGYTFSHWSGDADCDDNQVSITANRTCTAHFTINSYNVTVNVVGSGSISFSPPGTNCGSNCRTYDAGTQVTITASPSSGYEFSNWPPVGCDSINGNRCTTTVNGSITTTATFVQISNASSKIVFDSQRDGNREIYAMNSDGTNQTRLTSNNDFDGDPVWSPDGSKIAFISDRDGNREVYVMNANGTNPTRLTNTSAFEGSPAWSPDGIKIAFISARDGNNEVYVMNANGSNQTRFTSNNVFEGDPDWSPDGTKILFESERDGNREIYVMNANGTSQINLTNHSGLDSNPDWSPDGTKIAFQTNRDGNLDVYVMNANGSSQIQLTTNSTGDGNPSWSPNGSQIAFHSDRDGDTEIFVMGAGGTNQTPLTNNTASDTAPDWTLGVLSVPPPATGLVGEWNFDEASGSTALDTSGNSNHGSFRNGASYTTGVNGTALLLDGVNDLVRVEDAPSLDFGTGDFSLSVWVKTTASGRMDIIGNNWGSSTAIELHLFDEGKVTFLGIVSAVGISIAADNKPINDGKWHHLVAVKDSANSVGRIYVDGALIANGSDQGATLNPPQAWAIGARMNNGASSQSHFFNGSIDELKMYNRALTAQEILNQCNAVKPPELICSSSPPPPDPAPSLPFFDDFEDGDASDWTVLVKGGAAGHNHGSPSQEVESFGGSYVYSMQGGAFVGGGGGRIAMNGSTAWTDYTLTAEMEIIDTRHGGSHHGIAVRTNPSNTSYYSCYVSHDIGGIFGGVPSLKALGLERHDSTESSVQLANTTTTAVGLTIGYNQKILIKMQVEGSRIRCWFDNVLLFDEVDTTYPSGGIGLDTGSGHNHYDNISVTEISGPPPPPPSDLIAEWKFNESSGTTAQDSSGNGHHGQLFNGATFATGVSGNALQLDGQNDYVLIPDHNDFDITNLTIEGWILYNQIRPSPNGNQGILNKYRTDQSSESGYEAFIRAGDGYLDSGFKDNSGNVAGTAGPSTEGQWQHFAFTYDGATARLFVNGELINSSDKSITMSGNNLDMLVGVLRDQASSVHRYLGGKLDELRLYNKALTGQEVLARCNANKPNEVTCGTSSPSDPVLTIVKAGNGAGLVTSDPSGIDCGETCEKDFSSGTDITLNPQPNANVVFAGWSGDSGCSSGSFTLTSNLTCIATFNSASASPTSLLLSASKRSVIVGNTVTITASVRANGNPVEDGTLVAFVTKYGLFANGTRSINALTESGSVSVSFTARKADAITVLATVGTGAVKDTITVFFNKSGVEADHITDRDIDGDHKMDFMNLGVPGLKRVTIDNESGERTLTVAKFDDNPAEASFIASGGFFDVHLDEASGVNSVEIEFCPAESGELVYFWDGDSWTPVSDQEFVDGCIIVMITDSTFPTLEDLEGQFFGIGVPSTTGGDPPIWENIMAFPTPEKALGEDLNLDGDILDTVLRYKDLDTNEVFNTGIAVSSRHRDVDIYEDTIVFVEESQYRANVISTYNVKTKVVTRTGIIGYRPTIYGSILSVSGDTIRFYDLNTKEFVETGIPGQAQAIWGNVIAYHRTAIKGHHPTIRYYDTERKKVLNTKVAGIFPAIYENVIAFTTLEDMIDEDLNGDGDTKDSVVRYYDLNSLTLHNTRQVGAYPAIFENHIVFTTNKEIRYFDIELQQVFGTGKLGTEPDIYGNTITYYLWEKWPLEDLNDDGDQSDPIVRTYEISAQKAASESQPSTDLPLSIEPLSISKLLGYPNPVLASQVVTFVAEGSGIKEMNVSVYDLSGQKVFDSGFSPQKSLIWDTLNNNGQKVANGVYLYLITVKGSEDQVVRSKIRKLVILR